MNQLDFHKFSDFALSKLGQSLLEEVFADVISWALVVK